MKMRRTALAFLAAMTFTTVAAADEPTRVVIAGPKKDPIATRLEKETVALGFAPVMIGPIVACDRALIVEAVASAQASAALCSDGDVVAVWTAKSEGHQVELRDVVMRQDKKSPHGDEQVATRSAEIMRANVALREPEPEPEPEPAPAPAPPSSAPPASLDWSDLDNPDRPAPSPLAQRTAKLTASAGASVLTSTDATSPGVSLHAAFGVHRSFAVTIHADIPTGGVFVPSGAASTRTALIDTTELRISPGIAGVGVEMPLAAPSARFIPRFGVAVGGAWLYASRSAGTVGGSFGAPVPTDEANAFVVAPAGWATAALSVRIYGPVRGVVDGLVGTAAGRLTVRDEGVSRAHWGTPIGGLALRVEVLIP